MTALMDGLVIIVRQNKHVKMARKRTRVKMAVKFPELLEIVNVNVLKDMKAQVAKLQKIAPLEKTRRLVKMELLLASLETAPANVIIISRDCTVSLRKYVGVTFSTTLEVQS